MHISTRFSEALNSCNLPNLTCQGYIFAGRGGVLYTDYDVYRTGERGWVNVFVEFRDRGKEISNKLHEQKGDSLGGKGVLLLLGLGLSRKESRWGDLVIRNIWSERANPGTGQNSTLR